MNGIVLVIFIFLLAVVIRVSKIISLIQDLKSAQLRTRQLNFLLEGKNKQMTLLTNLFPKTSTLQSKESRINQLLDDISQILQWKMSAFWEFNEKGQFLEFKYHRGLSKEYLLVMEDLLHNKIPVGGFGSGRTISTKQPVVVNNWLKDPQLKGVEFLSQAGNIHSFAAFPVATNAKTYGTLHLYAPQINEFKLNEVQLFTTVANSLAVILENDDKKAVVD